MAGLISNVLLLAIQYVILDCTKRTLRSTNSAKDSLERCLREDRSMKDGMALTLKSTLNVCNNYHEDVYQPSLPHFTREATRDRDIYSGRINHNISLHQACEEVMLCMVQFILSQRPANINTRDKLGRTPVMAAAMKQHVTVFDFLVSQSCDLMAVDNNNDTVLHLACSGGSVDIVRKLVVNNTCDKEGRGAKGMTPVMRSALHGHRDVFDLLVRKGCDVTTLDYNINTILHVACSGGHVDMVKYILRKLNFDIECRGERGRTPRMVAAHCGHTNVFDFLASEGSDTFTVDDKKDNVLHVACIGGHVDMVQLILKKKLVDIDSKAKHGRTPVMRAAKCGQRSVVEFLVRTGCNLTGVDDYMNTVLHLACSGGHVSVVKYIISLQEISVNSRGKYGWTPITFAARYGHKSVAQHLVIKGCNIQIVDRFGNNVLHVASKYGHVDIMQYILAQNKLSIDSTGRLGRTSLMTAALFGQKAVFLFLENKGCKLMMLDILKNNILHLAGIGGHVSIIMHIVEKHNIGIDSRGQYETTPVMIAARFGHVNAVCYLVGKGCKLSVQDCLGNTILHAACISGNVATVKYIFSQMKTAIESIGQYGQTPVMTAANHGHVAVVRYLVRKGCDMSVHDSQGNTILHVACVSGKVDMVEYIFSKRKFEIESKGQYGRTPVIHAASRGLTTVVRYLVSKGCKLSMKDSLGNTILHTACISGSVDLVKYIFSQSKIGIESRDQDGMTPIVTAAFFGHVSVFKYLVSKGSNLTVTDFHGNNVLHCACVGGHLHMVKYILSQRTITIESMGQYHWTPVMTAAYYSHTSIVRYLVGKKCKLSVVDKSGKDILQVACMGGRGDVVKYLITLQPWSNTC